MTRIFNDPTNFADESRAGFALAEQQWARLVNGGVARAHRSDEPEVALVIGGGSGHYPAFAGLVGSGLAHGAVMGNIFASPSASQVYNVARRADQGRGVLLSYGNYAGDVLHFTEAQERLRAEGVDVRTVRVTDDVLSSPPEAIDQRRGIAGDLAVFKIAGASCARGDDLDGVERWANSANDNTRSVGIAFGGCTFPGATEPLFNVPPGVISVGLGIHGEPGIGEVPMLNAHQIAALLVSKILENSDDAPNRKSRRVVPILNGLGSVKYEELYVLYRDVATLLAAEQITVVDPHVGEFCTSFDMAGVSLTLLWLDDELEQLWLAPAAAAGYFKPAQADLDSALAEDDLVDLWAAADPEPGAKESYEAAQVLLAFAERAQKAIESNAAYLGEIDSVAGDGDHGIGMLRGITGAVAAGRRALTFQAGIRTTLHAMGDAWAERGGGTSGAIWCVILKTLGDALSDELAPGERDWVAGVTNARAAVESFGKAALGDKTMLDALIPFADSLEQAFNEGDGLASAVAAATISARNAAAATASFAARIGRARSHGDKSVGTPDPGAISFALICESLMEGS